MGEIIINHLERAGSSSIKEISIGSKTLKTLQTIPKFQLKSDIELFADNIKNLPEFSGAALDLWSISTVYQAITLADGQRSLDNMAQATTPAKKLLDERIVFLDPNTECYRYKFPVRVEKTKNGKVVHTRQSEIMNQRKFPQAVKEIFEKYGTTGHNTAWRELEKNKLLLSFVLWHMEQGLKYNAKLIISPAPLIDGSSRSMLNILAKINQIAKDITFEETDAFWSFYVPIHSDAFREDNRCKRIIQIIKQNITSNTLLILKFFRTKDILSESMSRIRLGRFLSTLDLLKKSLYDSIAIMALDTKAEGLAFMGNGIDFTCDPLGGVKDALQFKKPKGDDTGDKDETQSDPLKLYGKYLHPDTRDYTSVLDLIEMIKPGGILPHNCIFCNKLHGRLIDILGKNFPKRDEWNNGRRLHNFICRRDEDSWLKDAIKDGNQRAVETYLSQRIRGNKNLVDLLPSTSYH